MFWNNSGMLCLCERGIIPSSLLLLMFLLPANTLPIQLSQLVIMANPETHLLSPLSNSIPPPAPRLSPSRGPEDPLLRVVRPHPPDRPHAVHQPLPGPDYHLHHLHQRHHHVPGALQPAQGTPPWVPSPPPPLTPWAWAARRGRVGLLFVTALGFKDTLMKGPLLWGTMGL